MHEIQMFCHMYCVSLTDGDSTEALVLSLLYAIAMILQSCKLINITQKQNSTTYIS